MTTITDMEQHDIIAQWMLEQLGRREHLEHEWLIAAIREKFGHHWVKMSPKGGWEIDERVRKRFKEYTGCAVIFDRVEGLWRFRVESDPKGK